VTFDLARWAEPRRARINALLDSRLAQPPRSEDPGRLVEAMRYSLLSPGKRLRPLLALAAAQAVRGGGKVGEESRHELLGAAAVELVHCYSLVHDDLPAMDDDDLRRGQPTNHKVFGEATAILAGDGLLTLAFEWLAEAGAERPAEAVRAAAALARGAGMWGMVRGQARDLGEPPARGIDELERLHREKTGALFRAAVEVGAALAGAADAQMAGLGRFADGYGVAFQHADDLDDGEHGDLAAQARRRRAELVTDALAALDAFDGAADPLRALARALAP
jgi:geranylgeranyl pyrophosphate synthase